MTMLNGHKETFLLSLWRTVLGTLLAAAIIAAAHMAQKLSALETTVGDLDRTIQKLDGRLTWLERRRQMRP